MSKVSIFLTLDFGNWTLDLLLHGCSITQLVNVTGSNLFIGGNAALNLNQIAICLSELHQTLLGVTVLNNKNAAHAGLSAYGSRGHQDRRLQPILKNTD